MIVVSFLGHELFYDSNILEKTKTIIKKIVSSDNEIEFLFHNYGEFYKLCYDLVKEEKENLTEKKITMTIVSEHPSDWDSWQHRYKGFVFEDFDKWVCPFNKKEIAKFSFFQRCCLWSMEKSIVLVSYVYCDLDTRLSKNFKIASKSNLLLIDLTSKETQTTIDELILSFDEKQQFILRKRKEGATLKKIGFEVTVTTERVRQIEERLRRVLRESLYEYKKLANGIEGIEKD